jgi:hypothetical protein
MASVAADQNKQVPYVWDFDENETLCTAASLMENVTPPKALSPFASGRKKLLRSESVDSTKDESTGFFTCRTAPGAVFEAEDELRLHFKSDWHRFNLKRQIRNQDMLSEEDFLVQEDISSLSGSGDDESTDDEGSHAEGNSRNLPVTTVLYKGVRVRLWRALLSVDKDFSPRSTKWIVALFSTGHFAAGVFAQGKLVAHRTFHRYTSRRKQGGAQSAHDNKSGKARSVGAQIRRYNELELRKDIHALFTTKWKEHVAEADLIFLGTPKRNRSVFFQIPQGAKQARKASAFDRADPRIRGVPFMTDRPTLKECQRACRRLGSVEYVIATEETIEESVSAKLLPEKQQEEAGRQQNRPARITEQPAALPQSFGENNALHARVEKNDTKGVKQTLSKPENQVMLDEPNCEGNTPLHLAASNNLYDMVNLLLHSGANPMVTDPKGRPPFYVSASKKVRDMFRFYYGNNPSKWDYKAAGIGGAGMLTKESVEAKKAKNREKKRRSKARKKQERRAAKSLDSKREIDDYLSLREGATAQHASSGKDQKLTVSEEINLMQEINNVASIHFLDEDLLLMKTLECAEVNAIPTGAALNRINQGLAEGKTLDELVHGQSQNGKKKRRKKKLKKKPKRDEPKADPAAKRAALTENDEKKPGGPKLGGGEITINALSMREKRAMYFAKKFEEQK